MLHEHEHRTLTAKGRLYRGRGGGNGAFVVDKARTMAQYHISPSVDLRVLRLLTG